MEARLKKIEAYIDREDKAAGGARRWTPVGMLANLGGTGVVIALLVYIHASDLDNQNKYNSTVDQRFNTEEQQKQVNHAIRDGQFQAIGGRIDCLNGNMRAINPSSANC